MKNIYVFSGLGADKRVFQKMDFSQFSTTFVEWISPEPNEMMEHYAKRLLCQIKHEKPILLGLSFGGIIATEIGKLIQTEQIILIASAKKSNETPLYYRIAGKLKLHKLVPVSLMKSANIFSYWFFGIEVNSEKKSSSTF